MKRWTDDEIVADILALAEAIRARRDLWECDCALSMVRDGHRVKGNLVDAAAKVFGKPESWSWGVMCAWDNKAWVDIGAYSEADKAQFREGWNVGATARAAVEAS